jgi:hypothetical protein
MCWGRHFQSSQETLYTEKQIFKIKIPQTGLSTKYHEMLDPENNAIKLDFFIFDRIY